MPSGLCVSTCPDGFYLDVNDNNCKNCHLNCLTCKEKTQYDCLKCNAEFISMPDKSCALCNIKGYYINNG